MMHKIKKKAYEVVQGKEAFEMFKEPSENLLFLAYHSLYTLNKDHKITKDMAIELSKCIELSYNQLKSIKANSSYLNKVSYNEWQDFINFLKQLKFLEE